MNPTCPFDLVIGLDRSDRKADLYLIEPASGQRRKQTISTSPEALHDWLAQLRQEHPQARVGLCLEQPAVSLILFLETYRRTRAGLQMAAHHLEMLADQNTLSRGAL
jgi:hypothetical protein